MVIIRGLYIGSITGCIKVGCTYVWIVFCVSVTVDSGLGWFWNVFNWESFLDRKITYTVKLTVSFCFSIWHILVFLYLPVNLKKKYAWNKTLKTWTWPVIDCYSSWSDIQTFSCQTDKKNGTTIYPNTVKDYHFFGWRQKWEEKTTGCR